MPTRSVPLALLVVVSLLGPVASAETDLDAFMRQVLAKRDDNWKKLQQYILDEREVIELRGTDRQPMWGEQRDYTWYIRDGYFVRSPLRFNGVTIGEEDRRKYEAAFLRRQKEREKRQRQRDQAQAAETAAPAPELPAGDQPQTVDGLLVQTRQPQFISSAYFLRFRFEEGKYALAGREQLEGRDVLRIEYYPAKLYSDDQRRRQATSHDQKDPYDAELQRAFNKVALVTLWIEPKAHQIVKYTFDNVDFGFLPGQWLFRVTDVRASMTMSQPFSAASDVWLPRSLEVHGGVMLAAGPVEARYALEYHDYRQADVKAKIGIPRGR